MHVTRITSSRSSALSLIALSLCTPCPGQSAPVPVAAPDEVLQAWGVRAGEIQDLSLPVEPDAFAVTLRIAGVPRTLHLHPHDVRAPDFRLLVDDGVALRRVPTPPSVTYRGEVAGAPGSSVAASSIQGRLEAIVHLDGEVWGVQPVADRFPAVRHSAHLVYRASDHIDRGERCGNAGGPSVPRALEEGAPAPASAFEECELALDLDHLFYTSSVLGQSDVTTAQNAATSIVNGSSSIYKRDVGVQFVISAMIIRTTPVYSGSIQNRLGEFRSRWRNNHTNVRRDLAHLFSGQTGGGVIGVASLAVVCSQSSGFGASQVGFSTSRPSQVALVCHEIGHNFSADHCDGTPSGCQIMCSGLGGCGGIAGFAPVSINVIQSYAQSRSCLTTVAPRAPTLTAVTPSIYTSYRPRGVSLTGTDLDSVTSVQLGATTITTFAATPTTLNFALPSPFVIGQHSLTVTSPLGTSNAVALTVTGNHPGVLVAPMVHASGTSADYVAHSDAGWSTLFFVSAAAGPSVLPGIVTFEIGNGFASGPFQVAVLTAGQDGVARLSVAMPPGAPSGSLLYWQVVAYDPASPTLPAESSNSRTVPVL